MLPVHSDGVSDGTELVAWAIYGIVTWGLERRALPRARRQLQPEPSLRYSAVMPAVLLFSAMNICVPNLAQGDATLHRLEQLADLGSNVSRNLAAVA